MAKTSVVSMIGLTAHRNWKNQNTPLTTPFTNGLDVIIRTSETIIVVSAHNSFLHISTCPNRCSATLIDRSIVNLSCSVTTFARTVPRKPNALIMVTILERIFLSSRNTLWNELNLPLQENPDLQSHSGLIRLAQPPKKRLTVSVCRPPPTLNTTRTILPALALPTNALSLSINRGDLQHWQSTVEGIRTLVIIAQAPRAQLLVPTIQVLLQLLILLLRTLPLSPVLKHP